MQERGNLQVTLGMEQADYSKRVLITFRSNLSLAHSINHIDIQLHICFHYLIYTQYFSSQSLCVTSYGSSIQQAL